MSFQYTQALEQTLKETPTVRPDAIDRAAALLSDGNYPPGETLNRVAEILAQNLKNQSAS